MELDVYLRFAAALIFVLALILGVGWLARRAGLGTRMPRATGRPRRLAIVEVLPLDAKRRLVLVRRDDAEHLLLLGTASDLVVEPRIVAADAAAAPATPAFETVLAETGPEAGA
jgi:flagellar protein FliO/FliZ